MPSDARRIRSWYELPVLAPYRLDLTVSVLRRLSANVVDVLTPEGQYVCALTGSRGPVVVRVMQAQPNALTVTIEGDEREHNQSLELVRRILGVERNLAHFNRAAARIPWLKPLAKRMRGVKPPRYPTLWEACVNAIVFQQISLMAASAILRRIVITLGTAIESHGIPLYAFPTVASVQNAEDRVLRKAGLSLGKLTTLLLGHVRGEPVLLARRSGRKSAVARFTGTWRACALNSNLRMRYGVNKHETKTQSR